MDYNRIVVWPSPYSEQRLSLGDHGLLYTHIDVDVPLIERRRDVWEITEVANFGSDPESGIDMFTSLPYRRGSLKAFANGVEVDLVETFRRRSDQFEVSAGDINGKHVYCSYLPFQESFLLGDNSEQLKKIYQVQASPQFSSPVREIIHLSREYITSMMRILNLDIPLWVGGIGNRERGQSRNILPLVSPISLEYHLVPIQESIDILTKEALQLGANGLINILPALYTIEFFESVQASLSRLDEELERVL